MAQNLAMPLRSTSIPFRRDDCARVEALADECDVGLRAPLAARAGGCQSAVRALRVHLGARDCARARSCCCWSIRPRRSIGDEPKALVNRRARLRRARWRARRDAGSRVAIASRRTSVTLERRDRAASAARGSGGVDSDEGLRARTPAGGSEPLPARSDAWLASLRSLVDTSRAAYFL